MKVSYDLRFAHLPCGSWPYVANVIEILMGEHPETQWRVYHNDWSPPQQEIVETLRSRFSGENGRLELRKVKARCLSLRHHLEFSRIHDDADVYHYLHFDLPLGMRRIPLVVTIHDLYPLVLPGYCSAAKRGFFRFIARRNAHRAAAVITVSKSTRNDIVEQLSVPEDKIKVIPQGYSQKFRVIDDEGRLGRVRREHRLPERFILYTGNHKYHKNLRRLLQAYAALPRDMRSGIPMVLTGPITEETRQLQELARQLDIESLVSFTGLVPMADLPAMYNLASLLVLPSIYEGFGIPLVEAMACGTPVACADAAAMPEVVGDAGRLFDPYSVDDMTEALAAAVSNDIDNENVRQGCLERAKRYSWEHTAQLTYEVYKSVARGG